MVLIIVPRYGRCTPDFQFMMPAPASVPVRCTPKFPPEVGVRTAPVLGTVTLWPVVFQLSPQAAIANFGLTRTAPYRYRAPRSTKNYQNYRQVWP